MDFHLDRLLNLPYVTVESCHALEDYVCLNLRLLNDGITCPHCQQYTEQIHQARPVLVRDLSIFGRGVYLKVPRRQFVCPTCHRYTTEFLEFIDQERRHTIRYEQSIYQRVQATSIEQISREEQLKPDEIKGIFEDVARGRKKKIGVK